MDAWYHIPSSVCVKTALVSVGCCHLFPAGLLSPAGDQWRDRFYAVKGHKNTQLFVMTDELGPAPAGVDPYARNNLWQLYSALAWGEERLRFVCLWDGQGGDGPGGTQHVFEAARARTSHVYHLNTTRLFGLMPSA